MHQQCAIFWYSSSTLVVRKCIARKFKAEKAQFRKKIGTRHGKTAVISERVTPFDTYHTMGDYYFTRSYRMKYTTFVKPADMLKEGIIKCSGTHGTPRGYVNGPITHDVRQQSTILTTQLLMVTQQQLQYPSVHGTNLENDYHAFFAQHKYHVVTGLYGKKFNGYMGILSTVPGTRIECYRC
jgi:hypothetical protein